MKVKLIAHWPWNHTTESSGHYMAEAIALAENWSKAGATVTISSQGYVVRRFEPRKEG